MDREAQRIDKVQFAINGGTRLGPDTPVRAVWGGGRSEDSGLVGPVGQGRRSVLLEEFLLERTRLRRVRRGVTSSFGVTLTDGHEQGAQGQNQEDGRQQDDHGLDEACVGLDERQNAEDDCGRELDDLAGENCNTLTWDGKRLSAQ